MNEDKEKIARERFAKRFGLLIVLLLIIALILWLWFFRFYVYTRDAYVEGNQVYITSLRPGFVKSIHTDDTFLVHAGEVLVELDTTDAQIEMNRAEQAFAQAVREVCQQFHQVFALRAEIEIKKAELLRVLQDYTHRAGVLEAEAISREDFEHATAYLSEGFFSLKMAEALYDKAYALVQGTSVRTHPQVKLAEDKLRDAWVQLVRCRILSPVTGIAAQRTIQVGMWIEAGAPLLSVIALDQIWVNANFKETQLKDVRIGQRARLHSDLYGEEVLFHGKVVGLSAAAGNTFSLLPPQNLSGNWIKIVQRLPVRISLDPNELKDYPLRIGLSMEATVDLHDQTGPRLPHNTLAAPTYKTEVYETEERGDRECARAIFLQNIDPELTLYTDTPLVLDKLEISKEFKEALLQTKIESIQKQLSALFTVETFL